LKSKKKTINLIEENKENKKNQDNKENKPKATRKKQEDEKTNTKENVKPKHVAFEKRPLTSKAKAALEQKKNKRIISNTSSNTILAVAPISPNNLSTKKLKSRNTEPEKKHFSESILFLLNNIVKAKIIKIDLNKDAEKVKQKDTKTQRNKHLIVEKIDLNNVNQNRGERPRSELRSIKQVKNSEKMKGLIENLIFGVTNEVKKNIRDKTENRPKTSKKNELDFPIKMGVKQNSNVLEQNSVSTEASVFKGKVDDYIIGKEIGKGAYAIVKHSIHKPTGKEVAIKIYEKVKLLDIQKRNAVKREIQILKVINHDNIVRLHEVVDTPKQVSCINFKNNLLDSYSNGACKRNIAFELFKIKKQSSYER